jgi:hypothetical protein
VSRPAGFHRRPLAEPDVNLLAHPAPIKQPRQSNGVSVARIEVLLLPVASVMRPLDATPSLQLHYEPSSLLRVGPPQCSTSVRSPRGFRRLGFSLNIRATGSCSSARQPASASRPLYAGRRPLSHQAPADLSQEDHTPLVSTTLEFLTTRLRRVHFRSSLGCSPARVVLALFHQRTPPWLFTTAAAPESRSRGAFPHLSRSLTYSHGRLVHSELLLRVLLQHTMVKNLKRVTIA